MIRVIFSLLILSFSINAVAQEMELQPGTFTIELPETPAGQVSLFTDVFVEVPANATRLKVDFTVPDANRDSFAFLRADDNFFGFSSINDLINQSDFYSINTSAELSANSIIAHDFATPSISNRRVYLTVAIGEGGTANGTLSITFETTPNPNIPIEVAFDNPLGQDDCDLAQWDDPTPITPAGGNNATTLGQARRNAMLQAAANLSTELFGSTRVRINACWTSQGGTANSATLAGANQTFVFLTQAGLGRRNPEVSYSFSATTRLAGTTPCEISQSVDCDVPQIFIRFNTDVDSDVALAGVRWYYGFDDFESNSTVHFLSVAMHEITHGLGFSSNANQQGDFSIGSSTNEFPDIYTASLAFNNGADFFNLTDPGITDQQRADAFISSNSLQFTGPEASVSVANIFNTVNDGFVPMFAPNPYQPGSSVSHFGSAFCELMRSNNVACVTSPHRSLGLAKPVLHALGWAPSPNRPNYLGLMFDRSREGHGFDFQAGGIDPTDGETLYVLTFYSYESFGGNQPEWFQAVGKIRDGVFSGTRNADGFGFPRFTYDDSRTPPQQADPNARGQVVLSFNDPMSSAACNDGFDRSGAESVAVLQWLLGSTVREWCVEPISPSSTIPPIQQDFNGLWFVASDEGWGLSIENFAREDGTTDIFVLAFVYAADGTPVWYFSFGQGFEPGVPITMDMIQRTGFARTQTNGSLTDAVAGTMTLTLSEPTNNAVPGNRVTINATYLGSEGGDWIRNDVNIQRLNIARQSQ